MRNGAHKGRRGSADGDVEGHQNSTAGRGPATSTKSELLATVAEFQRNARGETVRILLSKIDGRAIFDARVCFKDKDTGESVPTKKGISVTIAKLPEFAAAVQLALDTATEMGLLKEGPR